MERQLCGFFFSFSTMNKETNWMENHFVRLGHYAVHQLYTLYPNTILRSVGMPSQTNQKFKWFTWVFSPALIPSENLGETQGQWKCDRIVFLSMAHWSESTVVWYQRRGNYLTYFSLFCFHTSAICTQCWEIILPTLIDGQLSILFHWSGSLCSLNEPPSKMSI